MCDVSLSLTSFYYNADNLKCVRKYNSRHHVSNLILICLIYRVDADDDDAAGGGVPENGICFCVAFNQKWANDSWHLSEKTNSFPSSFKKFKWKVYHALYCWCSCCTSFAAIAFDVIHGDYE